MTRSLLAAALEYARRGWHVIPLAPGSKKPSSDLLPARDPSRPKSASNPAAWESFARIAATEDQIRAWWEQTPDANIGLICGYTPGLLVIDLDPNKRDKSTGEYRLPEERRRALLACEGFEPTPIRVRTTSGGWHLYFRHPRAPTPVVTQKGHARGEGVDVQAGENCYVVAPPSIFRDRRYQWDGDPAAELPFAPTWVIDNSPDQDTRVYTGSFLSRVLRADLYEGGNDGGPGRNRTLRSMAQSLAKRGLPLDIVHAIVSEWNEHHCKPPLSAGEVWRQVTGQFTKVANDLGQDPSDKIRLVFDGPRFPLGILQEVAPVTSAYVEAMIVDRGLDPDLVGPLAIMVGGAMATHVDIEIEGERWSPKGLTWGFICAPSGLRKSAAFGTFTEAIGPIRRALERIALRWNTEIGTERELLEDAKRNARAVMNRAKSDGAREQARALVSRINQDIAELPAELPPTWVLSDVTPEAFQKLQAAIGFATLASEEGADILKGFLGHYARTPDASGFLKSWDGGSSDIGRVGSGHRTIEAAHASILLMTQPTVLAGLVATEAEGRGLLARFLFATVRDDPPPPQNIRLESEVITAAHDRFVQALRGVCFGGENRYREAMAAARDYEVETEPCDPFDFSDIQEEPDTPRRGRPPRQLVAPERRRLIPPVVRERYSIRVPAYAWAVIQQFQTEMTESSRSGGVHFGAAAWVNKAGDHAVRIAAILELLESGGSARELSYPIACAAVRLVREYFLPQYYVALDRMRRPECAGLGIHILRQFQDREGFSTVDVADSLRVDTSTAIDLCRWLESRSAISMKGRGRNFTCKVLPGVDY